MIIHLSIILSQELMNIKISLYLDRSLSLVRLQNLVRAFLPNPVFNMAPTHQVTKPCMQSPMKSCCFVMFQNLVPQLVKITSSKTSYR